MRCRLNISSLARREALRRCAPLDMLGERSRVSPAATTAWKAPPDAREHPRGSTRRGVQRAHSRQAYSKLRRVPFAPGLGDVFCHSFVEDSRLCFGSGVGRRPESAVEENGGGVRRGVNREQLAPGAHRWFGPRQAEEAGEEPARSYSFVACSRMPRSINGPRVMAKCSTVLRRSSIRRWRELFVVREVYISEPARGPNPNTLENSIA